MWSTQDRHYVESYRGSAVLDNYTKGLLEIASVFVFTSGIMIFITIGYLWYKKTTNVVFERTLFNNIFVFLFLLNVSTLFLILWTNEHQTNNCKTSTASISKSIDIVIIIVLLFSYSQITSSDKIKKKITFT